MFYFLSGFTAKLAGTEIGVKEPQPTFSACFGAPFLPQPPAVYAHMLGDKLDEHGSTVWLVNTGWTGGPYGEGERMPIAATRAMLHGGALRRARRRRVPHGRAVRLRGARVGAGRRLVAARPALDLGRPRRIRRAGAELAQMFRDNFAKFADEAGRGRRGRGRASSSAQSRRNASTASEEVVDLEHAVLEQVAEAPVRSLGANPGAPHTGPVSARFRRERCRPSV